MLEVYTAIDISKTNKYNSSIRFSNEMVKTVIQYEAFVKITETGSFTKAAESMGYTQSAVSQMIKTLEEELDTVLIHRSKKGIELSPTGKNFCRILKTYITPIEN